MKKDKKDKHGLAINIMKFQYYNFEFFNCQEIVLYETLIVLGGNSFAKREEFFHSTQTIADKTGIKRHSVDRIMMKFKKMGIIDYQIKGMPKVKFIKILWKNILEILPEIYQFDKVEEYF
ncbi:helix-turn-helix domain-containing protein, partial [bacterium]|nr:helix-turn-helix domain-containing protein [bacterium]